MTKNEYNSYHRQDIVDQNKDKINIGDIVAVPCYQRVYLGKVLKYCNTTILVKLVINIKDSKGRLITWRRYVHPDRVIKLGNLDTKYYGEVSSL